MLPETGVKVDLVNGEPAGTLPGVATDPEEENDGQGKDLLESVLNSADAALARGQDGDEDLSGQNDAAHGKTNPRAPDAESRLEGDAVVAATLAVPCGAEANVRLRNGQFT